MTTPDTDLRGTVINPTWRPYFKAPVEMRHRDPSQLQLVQGLFPFGVNFIAGLPGDGKSWFALALAKSLFFGVPFLDYFPITRQTPIVYLSPEVGECAFKTRLEKLGLADVRDGFYCQTLTDGPATPLTDPNLIAAVKDLKPAVFLDTTSRFNLALDENAAMQTAQGLAKNIFALLHHGAVSAVPIHHSQKSSRSEVAGLENSLRGSTDMAAMADSVYRVSCTDQKNFVATVTCVKARDFNPSDSFEFRGRPNLDEEGRLVLLRAPDLEAEEFIESQRKQVSQYIARHPRATHNEIASACRVQKARVPIFAKSEGWTQDKATRLWRQN